MSFSAKEARNKLAHKYALAEISSRPWAVEFNDP